MTSDNESLEFERTALRAERDELLVAFKALVAAIDFEGPDGRVQFNPGGPWEHDALRDARLAIAKIEPAVSQ